MASLEEKLHSTIDKYEAKDFGYFFKSLDGLSENLLKNHHTLYEGYIKKVNEINEKLGSVDRTSSNHNYSEMRGLLVDLTHNLNAVILHELYFSNLIDRETHPHEDFEKVIMRDFGSWDNYITDLKAACKAARGWAFTAYNYRDGKLHNFAIDGHNLHVPVFVKPILVIDVWEHAYMLDYAIDKPAYLNSVFENINWSVVSQRFEAALKHESGHESTR